MVEAEEAEESSEPLSVAVCASELVQPDDGVMDAETVGMTTSSVCGRPLSVPTKTCCVVDTPALVVALSGKMVAAAVAIALARTKSCEERIAIDFRDRDAESWQNIQECGDGIWIRDGKTAPGRLQRKSEARTITPTEPYETRAKRLLNQETVTRDNCGCGSRSFN